MKKDKDGRFDWGSGVSVAFFGVSVNAGRKVATSQQPSPTPHQEGHAVLAEARPGWLEQPQRAERQQAAALRLTRQGGRLAGLPCLSKDMVRGTC